MKASKESLNAAFEIQKSIAGNPESFGLVASALAIDRHFAQLRERLAAAEGAWIASKDRLPAKGQFILAAGPGLGNYIGGPEIDVCRWDGDQLWNEGGTELTDARFTHWMPLPKCP